MATLTHSRDDKAQHDQTSIYDDRTNPSDALAPGWTCDACEPGTIRGSVVDEQQTRDALKRFVCAAASVAMDTTDPDDDHARDFGLAVRDFRDTDDGLGLVVTLEDGRAYLLRVTTSTYIPAGPEKETPDALTITLCEYEDAPAEHYCTVCQLDLCDDHYHGTEHETHNGENVEPQAETRAELARVPWA